MTFSQYAGTAIVPTLARIVLAVAFTSAGWNKVFEKSTIDAAEATKLKVELGIDAERPGATSQPATADGTTLPAMPTATDQTQVRGVYRLALMLKENNLPQPLGMAWVAAFTELFGGAMLLIGLFSRIWGLGLAIAMGVAFYLTSVKMFGVFHTWPHIYAQDGMHYSTTFVQAGLFVLAFGVFLTGAGPLSFDRILFGGSDADPGEEVKID